MVAPQMKPKKSLGQHFLHDEGVLSKIAVAAELTPTDWVLEIGPGQGFMTRFVSEQCEKLTAVELDHQLVVRLQEEFVRSEKVSILEGNILDIEQRELLEATGYAEHGYKIVANIPYNITAPIIKTFLTAKVQPKLLVLMVQKEVAERLRAPAGETSLLSVMAQYYARVEYMFTVSREAFTPPPRVESAVVRLRPIRTANEATDRKFFRVVRIGFAARRKTLLNNILNGLRRNRGEIESILQSCGFRPDVRAQALSVADWEKLVKALEERALLG